MISKDKNFLFIHVPKTGGNSIQNILAAYADDTIVIENELQDGKERFQLKNDTIKISKHSALQEYKDQLDPAYYKSLYKFSVIRNPYERLVSFYFSPHRQVNEWNKDDFKKLILEEVEPLSHYIRTKSTGLKRLLDVNKSLDSELDYLIRFENLESDFDHVCKQLNIPFEGLPHRNQSNRDDYKKYYDDELLEMVQHQYADELKFGNYTF